MDDLAEAAIRVLAGNDRGRWTRPSPRLYPHQWSWDAGFVAIGWAHLDPVRGATELRSLFRGQWATGMVPHVVFDLNVAQGAYEPGPDAWGSLGHAPPGVATSTICQPAVHAIALARVHQLGIERGGTAADEVGAAVRELYPRLVAWHRWLHTARDPEGTGLVAIVHPWESGLDNSPRWDRPLAALDRVIDRALAAADQPAEIDRPDLRLVADPAERPTDADYRRYRYLVASLAGLGQDPARIWAEHPFLVGDVWSTGVLAAADDTLAELAVVAGRAADADEHRAAAERGRAALDRCWDTTRQRCLDVDLRRDEVLVSDTVAAFAPLLAGTSVDRGAVLVERLWSPTSAGHPGLRWPLPPSTAVDDAAFDPRAYWRGPQWPPMTWLMGRALERGGHRRSAARLRASALDQLRTVGCCEYVDPLDGTPLGSPAQSWTAAVALDWLAEDRS